jgi:hypothetical protein
MNGSVIGIWLVVGVLGSILGVQAASITLAWDPPNPSTEVTGYKLHYGRADTCDSEEYTEVRDARQQTQYTVDGLTEGTLYVFVVQAYGEHDRTSDFSNKVCHHVVPSSPILSSSQVVAVDSEEPAQGKWAGRNVLDADADTIWHTQWTGEEPPPHPHHILLDLGDVRTVYGIHYLPRQDGKLNGTIVGYQVYVSLDRDTWDAMPWMSGSWAPTVDAKVEVNSSGQRGRYVKLVATSGADNRPWTSAAEIRIIAEFP